MTDLARSVLPPLVSATKWETIWEGLRQQAAQRDNTGDPSAPYLTNREAAAFVRVWRNASTSKGPLWHQLAARAYGWNPPARKTFRATTRQADARYRDVTDLWHWSKSVAAELDARNDATPLPSIAPNLDSFGDPVFQAEIRNRLLGDGGHRVAAAPVPLKRKKPKGDNTKSLPWPLVLGALWWVFGSKRRHRR